MGRHLMQAERCSVPHQPPLHGRCVRAAARLLARGSLAAVRFEEAAAFAEKYARKQPRNFAVGSASTHPAPV